jgi:hypothetical protein
MAKFSDLGVESDVVVGKGIDIDELFGRRILIEKTIIQPTNFPGKNSSGLRMQMQVCLASFSENGDYVKRTDGTPDGERRSCFTGSDILIGAIQKAENNLPRINQEREKKGLDPLQLYPMDTTIVKVGKCFQFT